VNGSGREERMSETQKTQSWVVYRMTIHGRVPGVNAVCEQAEWDTMESAQPGHHTLIRAGISNEGEAERLAREAPGGTTGTAARLKVR
jgi:hypothetical protein